jgi:lysine 2,3-aminomutase
MIFQMQVKKELWRSYHWQIQNRVKTQEELERFLRLLPEEIEGIKKRREYILWL